MRTYTRNGKDYLVTRDWLVGELHIPMSVITDAITHAGDNSDDDFDAYQIEAYIRDSMTLFKSTDAEVIDVPSAEDILEENIKEGGPLELVINDEMYSFKITQYSTLTDLAVWISETLNQAMKRVVEANVAALEKELENLGFSRDGLKLTIKM